MDIKKIVISEKYHKIIWGIGVLLAVLIVFQAGVFVGFRKASFSFRGGENYYRTFGGGPKGMMGEFGPEFSPDDFPQAHGVSGQIIKVALPNIFVEGNDNVEKTVLVDKNTLVRQFRQIGTTTNLKVGDNIIVIGSPNDAGQIQAKLIRIMPTASAPAVATTTTQK